MTGGKPYINQQGRALFGRVTGSLKSRLQFLLVSAVVMTMLLAGMILSWGVRQDRLRVAIHKFDGIFVHVFDSLKERERKAGEVVKERAGQESLVAPVNMVFQYATPTSYEPLIFDVEKQRIANQLFHRVRSGDHFEQLAVYDGNGLLMAFDSSHAEATSTGYVSFEAGQPVVMLGRVGASGMVWERGDLPPDLKLQATIQAANGWSSYVRLENRLMIDAGAPLVRTFPDGSSQTIGWVIGQDFFVADFVQEVMDSTGAQFAVVLDDGTRIGGLLHDVDIGSIQEQIGQGPASDSLYTMIDDPDHFLAVRPLMTPQQGRVYLLAGMDRLGVETEIRNMLLALLGVLLFTAVLLLPLGAWASRRLVLVPLQGLVGAVDRIRQGAQGERVPLTGPNELEHLADSFNDMLVVLEDRERQLQRERDFASGLLGAAQMVVVLLDMKGRVQFVNPFFESLSGYRLDELRGLDWFERFVPESERQMRRDSFMHAVDAGEKRQYVNTVQMRDGRVRLVEWRTLPMHTQDGPGFLGVGMDVTEREEAREQLLHKERELQRFNAELEQRVQERTNDAQRQMLYNEMILRSTDEGYFSVDEAGRITNVNPAFCNLLGYSRAELLSMGISDFESEEDAAEVAAHIGKVMSEGGDLFETRHRRKDGSLVDVEVSATRAELDEGLVLFAFVRDITARKAVQATLQQARDSAERANAAKSDFLSRMSHELRTPLNAILGFGELLQTDPENPLTAEQADNLGEIMTAGQHLLGLVNEVLDLSRIESGNLSVTPERVAVQALIDVCVKQIQSLASKRSLTVAVDVAQDVELWGDPMRLRQVLLNLLSNAVKYNRDGGRVWVRTGPAPDGGLRIAVSDTGNGIPDEFLPRLFRPFERYETAYAGVEGTGIGLALVKKLVESMDGHVGVESVEGEGSTFWVDLPLAASVAPVRQFTLLYVEDNPANLRLVQRIMDKRPYIRLIEAINGEQGLAMALAEHPDLILLDINLPDMNGIEVLQALRQRTETADIPVLALSANAMKSDIRQGLDAGFADYLTKPIDVNRLLQAIDDHLGAARVVAQSHAPKN